MLTRIRARFVLVTGGVSLAVLTLVTLVLNLSLYFSFRQQVYVELDEVYESYMSTANDDERFPVARYFVVSVADGSSDYTVHNSDRFPFDPSRFVEYGDVAFSSDGFGFVDQLSYRVFQEEGLRNAVFIDSSQAIETQNSTRSLSIIIATASFVGIVCFAAMFSGKSTDAYVRTSERQKKFLTDASHELKTPVAVIKADLQVIEEETGKSEWIDSAKEQADRLKHLIEEVTELSKYGEDSYQAEFKEFDLTDSLLHSVAVFRGPIKAKGLTLTEEIPEDPFPFRGPKASLEKTYSILLDNALKYTPEGGSISITLVRNRRDTKIIFKNDCEEIDKKRVSKVFDRFYTVSESRSRNESGSGIGLAIASELAKKGNYQISAESATGRDFTVTIKLKNRKG